MLLESELFGATSIWALRITRISKSEGIGDAQDSAHPLKGELERMSSAGGRQKGNKEIVAGADCHCQQSLIQLSFRSPLWLDKVDEFGKVSRESHSKRTRT